MRCKAAVWAAVSSLVLAAHGPLVGQSYDPVTQSPMSLLSAPGDPVAYYEARTRIRALLEQRQAAEAEPLAEQVAREYPRDGENWLLLGSVKEALGKFAEAAAANERAGELLGWGLTAAPSVRAARTHLAAGNRRAALDLLRREVFERRLIVRSLLYDSEWFAPLRSDPEFLEIVGRVDSSGWSRDYGWRRDLAYLRDEVMRVNPDYHDRPFPPEFDRQFHELSRRVPELSDEEIFVGMNRMLAVLRQGHTGLQATGRIASNRLPFQVWAFPEGLFIIDAIEAHRELIGSRLVSIEGVPAHEVLRRVNELQSVDGDNEYLMLGPQKLRFTAYLKGLGIIRSLDSVRVTLQTPDGREPTITFGTPRSDFSLRLMPAPGVPAPLFLGNVRQFHWEVALPEQDAVYVQLNQVSDDPDETLEQFGRRLRIDLAQAAPKNLVLDMRHNIGGTTALYPELLRTLIGFSQLPGRRLYVLIGRHTYSAAANLITDLERLADPVFVGEASSECCALYGDTSSFTLPFSGIAGQVPGVRWNLSHNVFDGRREMSPEVPVLLTARDHFAGRDPVMETVFRMIAAGGTP